MRGGLALSVLLLVGQLTGTVPGPLEVWFGLLAFVYPLVLPPNRSPVVAPVVAGAYFGALVFADAPPTISTASIRALVVFAIGAAACLLGVVTRHLRGEQDRTEGQLRETEGVLRGGLRRRPRAGWRCWIWKGTWSRRTRRCATCWAGPARSSWVPPGRPTCIPTTPLQHTAAVERLVAGETWSIQREIRLRMKDRRAAWGLVGMSLVHDAAARPRHLFLHVTNLTDRVRAEARLRQSEAHFRNLFEMSPIPLWEVDLSGVVAHFERWHADGATDLAAFLRDRPEQAHLAASGGGRCGGPTRPPGPCSARPASESFAEEVAAGALGPGLPPGVAGPGRCPLARPDAP